MILAAGRGERLRPLTDRVPKALVEAGGKPLLAWHLERLAGAGFREVVINVSHLADQIVARFGDGGGYGLRIAWSREREALETAGGIAHAMGLLGDDAFVLLNADIWCDIDFGRLRNLSLGARLAHLVLAPNPDHRTQGDFALAADGAIGNGPAPRYTYTGVAVLSPALLAPVPAGASAPLAPLLREAAAGGRVSGELHPGFWIDVGTAERLAALDRMLRDRRVADPS
jgi:MurNAc alpha-1-phosphate uridylyltransferase